jgi:adenine/guanine phosphoribosyltransferase-like PRPP-binding protein
MYRWIFCAQVSNTTSRKPIVHRQGVFLHQVERKAPGDSAKHLVASDHVLLIDDFANGHAARAFDRPDRLWLGRRIAGIGVVIEKSFQRRIDQQGYRVERHWRASPRLLDGQVSFID